MSLDQQFVTIAGNLKDTYKQCAPGTMQCVDQIMNERRIDKSLHHQSFYTADGYLYCNEGEQQVLYICREMTADGSQILNPILKHIDDAFRQLTKKDNYQIALVDFDAVRNDPKTVRVVLNNLSLQGDEKKWCHLKISTTKYDTLNAEERKFAKRIYGQGTDFTANMQMLKDAGINETKVYMLDPDDVKIYAKEKVIGLASWLDPFLGYSNLSARVLDIDYYLRLRGVRRSEIQIATYSK